MHKKAGPLVIPPRAAFQLEPRAIGTWERQRLTSYVQEMATTALVRPHAVRDCYGPWPYGLRLRGRAPGPNKAYGINGSGECARNWANAIGELAGRSDLETLTLLPFASFARPGSGAHMHARRLWCARCLEDDVVLRDALPYERLLWSIRLVVACPLHETYLSGTCRACGRSLVTEIARDCLPGHCAFCGSFLGTRRRNTPEAARQPSEYELWVARDFGDLLNMSAQQLALASQENIAAMIGRGIAVACHGRPRDFAEDIRFARETVIQWSKGTRTLSLSVISSLSWIYGVPMRAWLCGDFAAWEKCCHRELPRGIHRDSDFRSRSNWVDWDTVAARLRVLAASDHPPKGVADAARMENMTVEALKSRLPEEYRLIRDAARERRGQSGAEHNAALRAHIRSCISELVEGGIPPTRTRVANRLGHGLYPRGDKMYWEELSSIAGDVVGVEWKPPSRRSPSSH